MLRLHLCFVIFALLLTSCGLKTFYVIDPPLNASPPNPADGDIINSLVLSNSFSFLSRDLSSSTFINPGTEIYYRIYQDQEDLQSDAIKINDANDEDTNNGYKQIISLNYKKLESTRGGENPFVPSSGGVTTVILTDKGLEVSNIFISGVSTGTKPTRWNDSFFNFDDTYEVDNSDYNIPKDGDADFESGSGETYQFVNAYAFSTGMDSSTFTPVQSEILSLGFLAYELN